MARAKIVAAEIEASREMYGAWSHAKSSTQIAGSNFHLGTARVFQYIMTIVAAFANEACVLGRTGVWNTDKIDQEVKEFLRLVVIDASVKYSHRKDLHVPRMIEHGGDISRDVMEHLETYPEWQHFLSDLLEVAKAHAQAKTRFIQRQQEEIAPVNEPHSVYAEPVHLPADLSRMKNLRNEIDGHDAILREALAANAKYEVPIAQWSPIRKSVDEICRILGIRNADFVFYGQVPAIRSQILPFRSKLQAAIDGLEPTNERSDPENVQKPHKSNRTFREAKPELLKNPDGMSGRKNAAIALGISEKTLDRRVKDKLLTPIGTGSLIRFKNKDLIRLLNQKKFRQTGQE